MRQLAPAKLTLSLHVTGLRPDGYHLIEAEMVTLDLADELYFGEGDGLEIVAGDDAVASRGVPAGSAGGPGQGVPAGDSNLVRRALAAVGRRAAVRLVKRIPPGAGLGGGSADAAAVLRWAGLGPGPCSRSLAPSAVALAAGLGADVPFCLAGGRARVCGAGEVLVPLPYEARIFVLLLPPFGVSTAAVYAAFDELGSRGGAGANDLEHAALAVEARLGAWRDALGDATGRAPAMAGSGSTWFVEGSIAELGLEGASTLKVGAETGRLLEVRTVP